MKEDIVKAMLDAGRGGGGLPETAGREKGNDNTADQGSRQGAPGQISPPGGTGFVI
jgi:hypothetical protein